MMSCSLAAFGASTLLKARPQALVLRLNFAQYRLELKERGTIRGLAGHILGAVSTTSTQQCATRPDAQDPVLHP